MLKERINQLFDILDAGTKDIAAYAKCDPSAISRLKSGARTPGSQSPAISKLIDGMVQYAIENDKLQLLMDTVNVYDEELIRTAIRSYLYENNNNYDRKLLPFSEKLDTVMSMCEMPNIRLSKIVNVDTSYISRFRKGLRSPKSNPELFNRICTALFDQLELMNCFPDLIKLINSSSNMQIDNPEKLSREELYINFHAWMNDFNKTDHEIIGHLLGTINSFSPNHDINIPPIKALVSDTLLNEDCHVYKGIKGLQNAVLRFLGNVIRNNSKELLLYSDQGMEWMVNDPDFRYKWAALMVLCAKQGTQIKIIHNLDRDISEMVEAVESWLPLYITGSVQSFYNTKPCGTRFKHTIFLCPDSACISSCHANGMDDKSIYNYYTDPDQLSFMKDNFETMLNDSDSLVDIKQDHASDSTNEILLKNDFNNLSLYLTNNKVVIVKNSPPGISITFNHPLICNAFQAYANKFGNKKEFQKRNSCTIHSYY